MRGKDDTTVERNSKTYDTTEAPLEWWDDHTSEFGMDRLVRHYQFLVEGTAYRFKTTLPSYISDEDLLSYGQMGLLRAIDRYDPTQGVFSRFASSYVYGAILDELRSQDWAPRGLRRDQRLVRQATAALSVNDPAPSTAQVAAHLGWDAARLESTIKRVTNSHHQTLDGTESIITTEQDVTSTVAADHLCAIFTDTFDLLDELAQYVLVRVYFLNETLTAVAKITELPLVIVRRVHTEALAVLLDRVRHAASVALT